MSKIVNSSGQEITFKDSPTTGNTTEPSNIEKRFGPYVPHVCVTIALVVITIAIGLVAYLEKDLRNECFELLKVMAVALVGFYGGAAAVRNSDKS